MLKKEAEGWRQSWIVAKPAKKHKSSGSSLDSITKLCALFNYHRAGNSKLTAKWNLKKKQHELSRQREADQSMIPAIQEGSHGHEGFVCHAFRKRLKSSSWESQLKRWIHEEHCLQAYSLACDYISYQNHSRFYRRLLQSITKTR